MRFLSLARAPGTSSLSPEQREVHVPAFNDGCELGTSALLPFPGAEISAKAEPFVTGCLAQKNSSEGPERRGHGRGDVKITRIVVDSFCTPMK